MKTALLDADQDKYNGAMRVCVVGVLVAVIGLAVLTTGASAYEPETQTLSDIDGDVVYENEELKIDVSGAEDLNVSAGGEIYLVEVVDEDNYGLEEPYSINNDSLVTDIQTDRLVPGNTFGFADSSANGNVTGVFSLTSTTFNTEWENSVATTSNTELEVETELTRTDTPPLVINTSSTELGNDRLKALFGGGESEQASDYPFERLGYDPDETDIEDVQDDGYLVITGWQNDDGNIVADFEALSESEGFPERGEYTFQFMLADTGKQSSASITIGSSDENAQFGKTAYEEPAGDLPSIQVSVAGRQDAFVQVTDGEAFTDVVYVEFDDANSQATIQINTRILGTDHEKYSGTDVYRTENIDSLVSAYHDGPSERVDGVGNPPFGDGKLPKANTPKYDGVPIFTNPSGDVLSYEDWLRQSGYIKSDEVKDDQLHAPLQEGEYRVFVAGTNNLNPDTQGVFTTETGTATEQLAGTSLVLQRPGVDTVSTYRLPASPAADNVESVPSEVSEETQTDRVAWGDRLVVEYDMAGIYGWMAAGGESRAVDYDRLTGEIPTQMLADMSNSNQDVEFEVEETEIVGNQNPTKVDLTSGGEATSAVVDYDSGKLYLVANLRNENTFTSEPPDEEIPFEASAKIGTEPEIETEYRFAGGDPLNGAFSTDTTANNPYVDVDDEVVVKEDVSVGPPEIQFRQTAFDLVPIQKSGSTELTMETNLASEKDGKVTIRDAQDPDEATVSSSRISIKDGELTAGPFDLTQFNHGEKVEIVVTIQGVYNEKFSGVVVDGTNDIVIYGDDITTGIEDPTTVDEGVFVSEVVSWGNPPVEGILPFDDRTDGVTENITDPVSGEDVAEEPTTNQTTSQQPEKNQTDNQTQQTEESTPQEQEDAESQQPEGTNQSAGDGSQSIENDDGVGGIGLGFVPLVGVVVFSMMIGVSMAIISKP